MRDLKVALEELKEEIGPGSPIRITSDPAADGDPAWSPDGRWLLYSQSDQFSGDLMLVENFR